MSQYKSARGRPIDWNQLRNGPNAVRTNEITKFKPEDPKRTPGKVSGHTPAPVEEVDEEAPVAVKKVTKRKAAVAPVVEPEVIDEAVDEAYLSKDESPEEYPEDSPED